MFDIPQDIRGLIFDCDGTLVDSMPSHWQAWHETFELFGKTCPHSFLVENAGAPIKQIVKNYNRKFNCDLEVSGFINEKRRRSRKKLKQVRPIQPVVDVVNNYYGKIPIAVASGGSRMNVEISLNAIGLIEKFETIVTSDDPVNGKPSPDIFFEAARRINVKPEKCLVFEDGDLGIYAAQKAGMSVIDVREYDI